jgi:hypothetical protein
MSDNSQEYYKISSLEYKGNFEFNEMHHDENGFSIIVEAENKAVYRIDWPGWVLSHRKSDESDRLLLIEELQKWNVLEYLIVECKNSEYIKWLIEQKYGIGVGEVKHIIISTSNDFIDVICYELPAISIVNRT